MLLYSGQRVISLLGKAPAKDIQESISFYQRFLKKRHASALAFLERALDVALVGFFPEILPLVFDEQLSLLKPAA